MRPVRNHTGLARARLPVALDQLSARYQGLVHQVAYGILLDWGDAQETLQDVFLQVWNCAHHFDTCREKSKDGLLE